uniref:Uncharacterized protein n=1 Tax=Oscillatoriales cyanobacterium SpSt-402 TaxID=2282168 RepID=A0A832H4X0_9CYAN
MLASVKSLLSSIVDYAGLFPPAKLGIREALRKYAQHQLSADTWMLNHFVLPISRLDEFVALLPEFSLRRCSLSLILSTDLQGAIAQSLTEQFTYVRSLNILNTSVAAVEFPPISPKEIAQILPILSSDIELFFEIPLSANLESYLVVLQQTGAAAKVRTGGITMDAFPTALQLSQFILSCAKAHIPFKATAGLHHALPSSYPITYEPNSCSACMHGFLNVAILSTLACQQKIALEEAQTVLQDRSISNFDFTDDGVTWQGHQLKLADIDAVRRRFFRSFGSCSFQEPIDALKELNLL